MAVKASTIWYVDAPDPVSVLAEHPESDQDAARALAERLFPGRTVVAGPQVSLTDAVRTEHRRLFVGCFPGLTVLCGHEFAAIRSTDLPTDFVRPLASEHTYLLATDPLHEWGAFAWWRRGSLRRSFSATAVRIIEDEGIPLTWELPFWSGEYPIEGAPGELPDPQSLPFDPQRFTAAASRQWLGFDYESPTSGPGQVLIGSFDLYEPGEQPPERLAKPAPADRERRPRFAWFRRRGDR